MEIMSEDARASITLIARSVKSAPAIPFINNIGTNTITVVRVEPKSGGAIDLITAAVSAEPLVRRSVMIIELSTTIPTLSASPERLIRFRLLPA